MTAATATAPDPEVARLGMWVFLAGEVLFFGVVMVAYAVARSHAPAGFAAAGSRTDLFLGTLNTAVLLVSSAVVAWTVECGAAGRTRAARRGLWGAAALGVVFLAVKACEYRAEWVQGLFPGPAFSVAAPGAELFFAWYFAVTGLHALHLAIGIACCAWLARRRQPPGGSQLHVLGLYWHFVDIVWILLYPLIYLVAPRS